MADAAVWEPSCKTTVQKYFDRLSSGDVSEAVNEIDPLLINFSSLVMQSLLLFFLCSMRNLFHRMLNNFLWDKVYPIQMCALCAFLKFV